MIERTRNIEEGQEHVAQKLTENCPRRGDECACCSKCASATLAQLQTQIDEELAEPRRNLRSDTHRTTDAFIS